MPDAGAADQGVRSKQATHSAQRIRKIAAAAPAPIAGDLETLAAYVESASDRILKEPSGHVEHDIEEAAGRVTTHLLENCGD